ncbi:hypothetical protein Pme01_09140 [Planosporangium mesophilum]|uniref:SRPBCC family protein n=1 Tax=Planosporangium mesophilum TaxID=689768 RepID=A0A8J3T8N9_9ACTN|nr:hypothetical protein Pme01_09140 [Planosporangium mesophilum]
MSTPQPRSTGDGATDTTPRQASTAGDDEPRAGTNDAAGARSEPPGDAARAAQAALGDAVQPGAGEVTATVIVNAPAAQVFEALLAWERQSDWIPFTRVRLVDGDGGEGSSIEAVTQVGPAVLRDEMRVIKVDRPYEIRVVHYGRVLRGPGVMRCTPMGGDRTQVVWHEWFHLPGGTAGKVAWPVLWPGSKVSLTQALRRFARMVEAGELP